MDAKFLTSKGWTDVAGKTVKDNRLQGALADYQETPNEKFPERINALQSAGKFAGLLQKDKEVVKDKKIISYLTELIKTAAARAKELEAESAKAKAEAKKQLAQAAKDKDEDDDDDKDTPLDIKYAKKLKTAIKTLQQTKDLVYRY